MLPSLDDLDLQYIASKSSCRFFFKGLMTSRSGANTVDNASGCNTPGGHGTDHTSPSRSSGCSTDHTRRRIDRILGEGLTPFLPVGVVILTGDPPVCPGLPLDPRGKGRGAVAGRTQLTIPLRPRGTGKNQTQSVMMTSLSRPALTLPSRRRIKRNLRLRCQVPSRGIWRSISGSLFPRRSALQC